MSLADGPIDAKPKACDWRLTSWVSGIQQALGFQALFLFGLGLVVLLSPTVLLAGYSLYSHRPTLLIFVACSLWGFFHASPGPTGIGLIANFLVAVIAFGIAVARRDILLALSGVLPGFTWFGACALLGITVQSIWKEVQSSQTLFRSMVESGVIERASLDNSSQSLVTLAERDSSGESSL